jgi:hypothetical protein
MSSIPKIPIPCKRVRELRANASCQPTPTWLRDLQRCFSKSNPRAIHEAQASAVGISPTKHLQTLLWWALQGESDR